MLNEKRVKHMVKLASYENKHGLADFKAGSFFKRDYISYNLIVSLLWVTWGYFTLVVILGMTYMNEILEKLSFANLAWIATGIILIYVGALFLYARLAKAYYKKKHFQARKNVKGFIDDLEALEKMYEKEDV